ncbi:MAG: DUF6789 family protein [Rubrivivax sp.]
MTSVGKGMLAALSATVVLSLLMVMKTMLGVMPALDLPKMLATMMDAPASPLLGWVAHFVIGVAGYGVAIATLGHRMGQSPTVSGIVIGVIGWLLMMVVLMPLAGAGLFALSMGPMAPVMTLALHLIFGAVLGWTYGKLVAADVLPASQPHAVRP